MRPVRVGVSGAAGVTAPIPLDNYQTPFSVGIGVAVTGTVNYTVQHTFDDVFAPSFDPTTAVWYPHASLVNAIASLDGNYGYPVRAVRLNMNSGTGTCTMTVIQAGMPGR